MCRYPSGNGWKTGASDGWIYLVKKWDMTDKGPLVIDEVAFGTHEHPGQLLRVQVWQHGHSEPHSAFFCVAVRQDDEGRWVPELTPEGESNRSARLEP